ncbi:15683_t:CDS:2, partial [Cetraspora pellucida]
CFFIPLSTYAADYNVTVGPGTTFVPQNLTVMPGDRVIWNWAGGQHDVVQTDGPASSCTKSADANAFQSLVSPPTNNYMITINKTSGAYFYMCSVLTHCSAGGMWGVITIGGSGTPSASPNGSPTGGSGSASGSPSSSPTRSSSTKNVTSNFM